MLAIIIIIYLDGQNQAPENLVISWDNARKERIPDSPPLEDQPI